MLPKGQLTDWRVGNRFLMNGDFENKLEIVIYDRVVLIIKNVVRLRGVGNTRQFCRFLVAPIGAGDGSFLDG